MRLYANRCPFVPHVGPSTYLVLCGFNSFACRGIVRAARKADVQKYFSERDGGLRRARSSGIGFLEGFPKLVADGLVCNGMEGQVDSAADVHRLYFVRFEPTQKCIAIGCKEPEVRLLSGHLERMGFRDLANSPHFAGAMPSQGACFERRTEAELEPRFQVVRGVSEGRMTYKSNRVNRALHVSVQQQRCVLKQRPGKRSDLSGIHRGCSWDCRHITVAAPRTHLAYEILWIVRGKCFDEFRFHFSDNYVRRIIGANKITHLSFRLFREPILAHGSHHAHPNSGLRGYPRALPECRADGTGQPLGAH
jgi:hypothetical protein